MPASAEHRVAEDEVGRALRSAARFGRFFDLSGEGIDEAVAWRPFSDLAGSEVPESLRRALATLSARLGATTARPVASLLQMSAAAQLCSPLLATAAADDVVPELAAAHLEYGFGEAGGFRARLVATPTGRTGDVVLLARGLGDQIDRGPLAVFESALAKSVGIPPKTSRGNVASALVGALTQLGAGHGDPVVARRAAELVDVLLATGLRDSGGFRAGSGAERTFRRRSCCLLYQVPGAGLCGDCVLAA